MSTASLNTIHSGTCNQCRLWRNGVMSTGTEDQPGCDIVPLHSLHWLQVPEWIVFRLAVLMYHCHHGTAPAYLSADLLCISKHRPTATTSFRDNLSTHWPSHPKHPPSVTMPLLHQLFGTAYRRRCGVVVLITTVVQLLLTISRPSFSSAPMHCM